MFPALLGWFLLCSQLSILYITQNAFGRLLVSKGCKCANELPELIRRLDAELEMKHLLGTMTMFENCGCEFLDAVMANLVPCTYRTKDVICTSGTSADSMLFLCKGYTDVHTAEGVMLGTLSPGDHFGDGALLSDELRMGTVTGRTLCVLFELKRASLTALGDAYPAAVKQLLNFCLERAEADDHGNIGVGQGVGHVGHTKEQVCKLQELGQCIPTLDLAQVRSCVV